MDRELLESIIGVMITATVAVIISLFGFELYESLVLALLVWIAIDNRRH